MKILITHYSICDYGGLVNDTEIMTHGFCSMGHEVSNIMLTPKSYGFKKGVRKEPKVKNEWEVGIGTGLYIHHKSGWFGMDCFGFLDKSKIKEWNKFAKQFDIIIHQNPVPTLRKEYRGNSNWKLLYRVKVPQIVISPDANFRDSYPHLLEVIGNIKGVACTHEAGYEACSVLPVPRVLLPGPHIIDLKDTKLKCAGKRKRGFISVQNFKPIKHVDDLVRAIPYMKKSTSKILAGGGIEYHYMNSKMGRTKPKYIDDKTKRPIWDLAIDAGMKFMGYISNDKRDSIMSHVELLIDCSWSNKYSEMGPHFNRTFIEAMKMGCVPVCTSLGMGGSMVFKPNLHYIEIPPSADGRRLAEIIEDVLNSKDLLDRIRKTNVKKLKEFDHIYICKQLINLAIDSSSSEGLLGPAETGSLDKEVVKASKLKMEFFNE